MPHPFRVVCSAVFICGLLAEIASTLPVRATEPPKPQPAANAAPAPVTSDPATTTASYGDWVLRCQRLAEGTKPGQICEVAQIIQIQGQQGPFAQIALGRLPGDKQLNVTVVLPSNISLPSVARLEGKDKAKDLAWTRCTPGGCIAGAAMTDDVLKSWRSSTEAGKLTFKDALGRDIGLPISFRGMSQALDALPQVP